MATAPALIAPTPSQVGRDEAVSGGAFAGGGSGGLGGSSRGRPSVWRTSSRALRRASSATEQSATSQWFFWVLRVCLSAVRTSSKLAVKVEPSLPMLPLTT